MIDWKIAALRVFLSVLAGSVLGMNRERAGKSAGLRTYVLVAGSAAVAGMTGIWMAQNVGDTDIGRLPAAFISGLGFLGAGTIISREGELRVNGMTTAAGLLGIAITGIAFGAGFYVGGAAAFLVSVFGVILLRDPARRVDKAGQKGRLYCELTSRVFLKSLLNCVDGLGGSISDMKVESLDGSQGPIAVTLVVEEGEQATLEQILDAVKGMDKVTFAIYI